MEKKIELILNISHSQEGTYFTLPFTIPESIGSLTLHYEYERYGHSLLNGNYGDFISEPENNIIDLGLISPDGSQVGASGSDKNEIFINEVRATPGYLPTKLIPGEWKILIGAYKIADSGCEVHYTIKMHEKEQILLHGDLHTHTLASDGVHTLSELGFKALRSGLQFIAITDHNQMVSKSSFPDVPGLTFIPGIEWTHYQGHANFLGVNQPYDEPFATKTEDEAISRFMSAHQRGALITINHPFDEQCGFQFDLTKIPFDCIEIWNGPMRESNLRALGFWQHLLVSGKRIPMCGGSDYHRDTPFIFLGGPTTTVSAWSTSADDILAAIRNGNSYLTFAPNGPELEFSAGDVMYSGTVSWNDEKKLRVKGRGLLAGDVVRVVTNTTTETILQASGRGGFDLSYELNSPGFARIEILRAFLPGLPLLPALLSNPIWFDE